MIDLEARILTLKFIMRQQSYDWSWGQNFNLEIDYASAVIWLTLRPEL